MNAAAIYVATHTNFMAPNDKNYIPIAVGKTLFPDRTVYPGDNRGENISLLNEYFCEMTLLYWVWKNTSDELVGICHYRRYFGYQNKFIDLYSMNNSDDQNIMKKLTPIAASDDFWELQHGADIILPSPFDFGHPLIINYDDSHIAHDLFLCRKIIKKLHPEYIDAFDFVILHTKKTYLCNMIVTRRAIFSEYCAWVFSILLEMARGDFYKFYDKYQKRVFGFLAERLMNVWMCYNRDRFCIAERELVNVQTV